MRRDPAGGRRRDAVAGRSGSDDPATSPTRPPSRPARTWRCSRPGSQAAGQDLNYGTLESAIDGLKVPIPGDPTVRTYGPPPAADGNPTAYLFAWDEARRTS